MRKITAFLLSLCLALLLLVTPGMAAELNAFFTAQELAENGSRLLVYGSKLPENGTLTVSIDSQTIPDARLSTVRQEELPVTVYCLVDISGHLSKQQLQEEKDILNIISSRMGENDTMVITTVGSKVVEGALLETLEARKTAISTLKREGNKADLYNGIVTAMTALEQKTSYHANRCLLILSDGLLSGDTTSRQALDAVAATTIPVYALGVTGGSETPYAVKHAQKILDIAESSRNGLGLIPAKEDLSAAAAAQEIWEHIQESSVISIDLAGVTATGNNALLRARYQVGDTQLEDSMTIDLTQLQTLPRETEPLPETTVLPELPEEPVGSGGGEVPLLAIVGGVLAVFALAVYLLLRKKGKASQPAPVVEDILSTGDLDAPEEAPSYPKTAPAAVTVRLTMVSHENVTVSFPLPSHSQQILGRDDRADIILNAQDYQLSGKHCMVEWDDSYLYLQDLGSTNGTVLNGIPLKPNTWNRLNNGATLTLGSFQYQVTIEK